MRIQRRGVVNAYGFVIPSAEDIRPKLPRDPYRVNKRQGDGELSQLAAISGAM